MGGIFHLDIFPLLLSPHVLPLTSVNLHMHTQKWCGIILCHDLIPFFLVFGSNVIVPTRVVYARTLGNSFVGNGIRKPILFYFDMLKDDHGIGSEDEVKRSEPDFQSIVIGHFTSF